jgi:hypothetical protein
MQDLSSDIIGTNPSYPKLVNHDWLKPNLATYDNYPSDNNPVRIGPKLAEIWNTGATPSISLIPNCTVQQLGVQSSDNRATETVTSVVREAKKAMMSGLSGHGLAEHLRARFASEDILQAKTALSELSNEQGLLGNVYIDASAFSSANEAEQFMAQHRTRLAQDIIVNGSVVSANVLGFLANKFRKNVLATVNYDQVTFDKYKNHLVASGRIGSDFVIDSKESLRAAFLSIPEVVEAKAEAKPMPKFDPAVLEKLVKTDKDKKASDEVLFRKSQPILEFARAQLVKGKNAGALKEMLRGKYAAQDINDATKYLAVVCAEVTNLPAFTAENIDTMVASDKISSFVGVELKKLASKYPFKKAEYVQEQKVERPIGQQAQVYALVGNKVSDDLDVYRRASIEALRKGIDVYAIRTKLMNKLAMADADRVISEAMVAFNASPVGIKANAPEKVAKKKVVADLVEKETLPDPSTIASKSQEIVGFFDNAEGMTIDVDGPVARESLVIGGLFSKNGLDSIM